MVILRQAEIKDINQIQRVEREYYEGFNCPLETLKSWIKELPENFIVAEENGSIVGFIFFEYIDSIKAIPFIHKIEQKTGKYVYISEVGVSDNFQNSDVLQRLFDKVFEKSKNKGCKAIIWLTGYKGKHDKLETVVLQNNGFHKKENVKHWEYCPNKFTDDHFIWVKEIEIEK